MYIILIMQQPLIEPISFIEELCICNEEGYVALFPDMESAVSFRDEHSIDGIVAKLPTY